MKRIAVLGAVVTALIAFCPETDRAQSAAPPAPVPVPAGTLTIPAGHKFIMQLETPLHTRTTRKGS